MQRDHKDFVEWFVAVAADSDYSSYAKLQRTTSEDIKAAGEALVQHLTAKGADLTKVGEELTGEKVVEALFAKAEHYMDDNELVSVNHQDYWDATDGLGFSSGLRQQMQEELSAKYLTEKKSQGATVVNGPNGIWVFVFEG